MSKATLRIGVSGHQQIGDKATIEFVSQQLRELLATFQCQAHENGQEIVAKSMPRGVKSSVKSNFYRKDKT